MITKGSIDHLIKEGTEIKIDGESIAVGKIKSVSVGVPIDLESVYSIDSSGSHPIIGTISSEGSWTIGSVGEHTISGTVTLTGGTLISSSITYHAYITWEPSEEAMHLVDIFSRLT